VKQRQIYCLTPAARSLVSRMCVYTSRKVHDIASAACWLVSLLRAFETTKQSLRVVLFPGNLIKPFGARTYLHNQTSNILLSNTINITLHESFMPKCVFDVFCFLYICYVIREFHTFYTDIMARKYILSTCTSKSKTHVSFIVLRVTCNSKSNLT